MGGGIGQIAFLVVFIGIMYMLLIRPQKKKEKAINEMRSKIQVGDEIITIGGIRGKIVKTKDDTLVIQVGADKVKFEIMRWSVSTVLISGERTSSQKTRPVEDDEVQEPEKKPLPKKMKKADTATAADKAPVEAPAQDSESDSKPDTEETDERW